MPALQISRSVLVVMVVAGRPLLVGEIVFFVTRLMLSDGEPCGNGRRRHSTNVRMEMA